MVSYALADAAHYVRPGMALFDEALRRGVSTYLPGLTVPMLPRALSEGIVSLNPNVDRRALVFEMELDRRGVCRSTRLARARVHSRAKLTYDGVQRFHDHPEGDPLSGRDFTESLELLRVVGELRLELARARDVVHFRRREAVVIRNHDAGRRFDIVEEERNDVSLWNEQISLLCNIEGGRFLANDPQPHVQPIYRVHESPSPEGLDHVCRIIDHLVRLHDLDPARWTWRRRGEGAKSLSDYLDDLPRDAETDRIRWAIERQVLIVNQRSVYSDEPGRHFALGVQPYTRFSAPMREIVGIFTHKEALEKLGLIVPAATAAQDEAMRERVIASANAAKERQGSISKDVMRLAVDELLRGDLELSLAERPRYLGTVISIRPSGLYVQLDEPPVPLKVYLPHLEASLGQRYVCQSDGMELVPRDEADGPRFRVGDRVRLRCHARDGGKWVLGISR